MAFISKEGVVGHAVGADILKRTGHAIGNAAQKAVTFVGSCVVHVLVAGGTNAHAVQSASYASSTCGVATDAIPFFSDGHVVEAEFAEVVNHARIAVCHVALVATSEGVECET